MLTALSAQAEFEVRGLDGDELDNVMAHLTDLELDPRRRGRAAQLIDNVVDEALQPYGHYHSNVEVNWEDDGQTVAVTVSKGPPTLITDVRLSVVDANGQDLASNYRHILTLKRQQVLNHRRYELAKRSIQVALYDDGYLDADLTTHRIVVDRQQKSAEIELQWQIGLPYRIGEIRFSGSQFSDPFMRRFIQFENGQTFNQDQLLDASERLADSGYFRTATVYPVLDERDGQVVPVMIEVAPSARHLWLGGFSYGTDSGFGVQGDYTRRWLNRRGHRLKVSANIAQEKSHAGINYRIPDGGRSDAYYGIDLAYVTENTSSFETDSYRLGVSHLRRIGDWRRTQSVTYLDEDFVVASEFEQSTMLIGALGFARSRGEDQVVPVSGDLLGLEFRLASDDLLSDTSMAQLEFEHRYITTLSDPWRLLTRARLATTWANKPLNLPVSLRYFAGGDRSIRGYDFQSLGPKNDDGEVIGGKHLAVVSVELERAFTDTWRGAVFVDGGNAFNDLDADLEAGAGIGIRFVSPIGMIRLDVAAPLTSSELDPRFHLVIGPDL
ncbi:MAG: outer membrane protein assembly factor [Lysobacteraceae bacterium]|nr:MAG: outer membrane protein assembly factor [Xanthomonadaceae bacterium]